MTVTIGYETTEESLITWVDVHVGGGRGGGEAPLLPRGRDHPQTGQARHLRLATAVNRNRALAHAALPPGADGDANPEVLG